MGYTTDFEGELTFNKPVTEELKEYINKFSDTRRMKRDNEKIKELFPNWKELCFKGNLGVNGEYFIGSTDCYGSDRDESVIDYNSCNPQPGLWCEWIINDRGNLEWNYSEKFYYYDEWLRYLIKNFFEPEGYVLNGKIKFYGEDDDDFGVINVIDNDVSLQYGIKVMSLEEIETSMLMEELISRGYTVSK